MTNEVNGKGCERKLVRPQEHDLLISKKKLEKLWPSDKQISRQTVEPGTSKVRVNKRGNIEARSCNNCCSWRAM